MKLNDGKNKEEKKKLAIYYSNRAAIHLKMENYGLAINDADCAIDVDSEYAKSYYRKADGYIAIDKYKEAKECLKIVVIKMKIKDKDAIDKYNFVNKVIKERAFLEAIHNEE